jgi:hypothetical protein
VSTSSFPGGERITASGQNAALLVSLVLITAWPGVGAPVVEPRWSVSIARVSTPAAVTLPARTYPRYRGRALEQLLIEERSEVLQGGYLIEVRVRNAARAVQTLRWDVSRSAHLVLADGGVVKPIGHKLHGLSESSLAVRGVLEVDLPPKASYRLYPVFSLPRLPQGAKLVLDSLGSVPVPR